MVKALQAENTQRDDAAQQEQACRECGGVARPEAELAQLGAPLAAVVAAAFHGHGQLVGAAERADEQRHEYRQQRLGAADQTARLKIGAARLLRSAMLIIMASSCTGNLILFSGESSDSSPSVREIGEVV